MSRNETFNEDDFLGPEIPFQGKLKFNEWEKKKVYEENVLMLNIRAIDVDGTLEICKYQDRSLCKSVPEVDIVDGFIVIKVRREQ